MLKIKDNIDLKELEKYGFKDTCPWYYEFKKNESTFEVEKYTKNIGIESKAGNCSWGHCRELDILFDLFQAGLIEKV